MGIIKLGSKGIESVDGRSVNRTGGQACVLNNGAMSLHDTPASKAEQPEIGSQPGISNKPSTF